jgi:hypothetical protein
VEKEQRFVNAAQVAGTVIDERNHLEMREQDRDKKSNVGEFLFRAKPQLTASGVDVVTLFAAKGGRNAMSFEGVEEVILGIVGGALPGEALDEVIGDEVDFGVKAAGDLSERLNLSERIVDAFYEDVFEGDHAAFDADIGFARGDELGQWVFAIDGHDALADVIGGAMKGDGEAELFGFAGESLYLGHEPAGGDGDFAGADVGAPRSVEDAEGDEKVIVVGERFAHAHDHKVVDGA